MMRTTQLAFYILLMEVLPGCGSSALPELASIEKVGPDIVEEGETLWLEGEGFVEGPVELLLEGVFTPAGLARPWHRRVGLEAMSTSPSHIELRATDSVLARVSDEPVVFRGIITARFPSAPGAQLAVEARSGEVTLELRPSGSAVRVTAQRTRQAERYLEMLGMSLLPSGHPAELIIASVLPNSAADRAGIAPMDRILGVNERSLGDLSELGGIDISSAHKFELVSAAGEMRSVVLRQRAPLSLESDEMFALALAASVLGAFFVFAAPRRRIRGLEMPGGAIRLAAPLFASLPAMLLPLIVDIDADRPALLVSLFAASAVTLCGYELSSGEALRIRLARALLRLGVLVAAGFGAIAWEGAQRISASVLSPSGPFTSALALTTPAHLAVLLGSLSLLYPSGRGANSLAGALRDIAALPSVLAMVLLWLPPTSMGASLPGSWGEGATLYMVTAAMLAVSAQAAPSPTMRRRRVAKDWSIAWRLLILAGAYGATAAVSRWGLPIDSRAMAAVVTTALFFAIVAAAVASAWRGGAQRSAAMRARTNSAMDGGTSPLISPP